jgi:hypothetical protein
MSKTIIGKNNVLYLKSEIDQHYDIQTIKEINSEFCKNKVIDYINILSSFVKQSYMFIVPDKSIIMKSTLPDNYISYDKCCRIIDIINHDNIYNLTDHITNLSSNDYYQSDSHSNNSAAIKFSKTILKLLLNEEFDITNKLIFKEYKNFLGDLTTSHNLKDQSNIERFKETVIYSSVVHDFIDLTKTIPLNFRFCFVRESIYYLNKDAICDKKILIFGDSTTFCNKIFDIISLYFKESFFYWNHFIINTELINYFKPDIVLDIRTERFLTFSHVKSDSKHILTDPFNSFELKCKIFTSDEVIKRLILSSNCNNICNQINSKQEIIDNLDFFTKLMLMNEHNYKEKLDLYKDDNVIDFNYIDYIDLNQDLLIEFNKQNDFIIDKNTFKTIGILDNSIMYIKLIHHYYYKCSIENRKYKYDNIPNDFNWRTYIYINKDLSYMNNLLAINHYEKCGYIENRKYKYENLPNDFDWKSYISIHDDLKTMNELDAKNHYEYDGYRENRKYK